MNFIKLILILILSGFSKCVIGQYKLSQFHVMVGTKKYNEERHKTRMFLTGLGKDFSIAGYHLTSNLITETNFSKQVAFSLNIRFAYTKEIAPQNLYPLLELSIPFQNKEHKLSQDLGPINIRFGLEYVLNKNNRIGIVLGLTESWRPFFGAELRQNFRIKTKLKQNSKFCPEV